jgi:FkbM family methyltransferase
MNRRDFFVGAGTGAVGCAAVAELAWNRTRPEPLPVGNPWDPFARKSFAQQGEDIVLYHALHDELKIERPVYMDVGAAHPVQANNTYLLYFTGCHGVLVEPNPTFVKMLREWRPRDTVVAGGIGVTDDKEADYYEIKGNPLLNTFSREAVENLQKGKTENVVERVVKMPLININRAIADNLGSAPDVLSTDVEGLDTAILKALDLQRFRPGVICAEGVSTYRNGSPSDLAKYLSEHGYIQRGGSMVNSIFLDGKRIEV